MLGLYRTRLAMNWDPHWLLFPKFWRMENWKLETCFLNYYYFLASQTGKWKWIIIDFVSGESGFIRHELAFTFFEYRWRCVINNFPESDSIARWGPKKACYAWEPKVGSSVASTFGFYIFIQINDFGFWMFGFAFVSINYKKTCIQDFNRCK